MPLPEPLTVHTTNTPELKTILRAAQAADSLEKVKESKDMGSLLDQAMTALDDATGTPAAEQPGWLSEVAEIAQGELGIQSRTSKGWIPCAGHLQRLDGRPPGWVFPQPLRAVSVALADRLQAVRLH